MKVQICPGSSLPRTQAETWLCLRKWVCVTRPGGAPVEDFSLAIVDAQTGWVPKPHFLSSTSVYLPAFGKDREQSGLVRDISKGTGKQDLSVQPSCPS